MSTDDAPATANGARAHPSLVRIGLIEWSLLAAGYFASYSWLYDLRWYFAAGQRLNDGHALYALVPGDLLIPVAGTAYAIGAQYTTPFPYPPLLAVLWRPLEAAGSLGVGLWMTSMLAVMVFAWLVLFRRSPFVAAIIAPGLGYLWGSGNVVGFLFAALVLAWRFRDRPAIGALFGILAVIKLYPAVFLFVLIADRNWRSVAAFGIGAVAMVALGILGAGAAPMLQYPGVAATMGTDWLAPALLVAGSLLTACLRGPWAYRAAILTLTLPFGLSLAGGSLIGLVALPRGDPTRAGPGRPNA